MKKPKLIVKKPYDGDPLNQGENVHPPRSEWMSIGWKYQARSGKWYGDYILLPAGSDGRTMAKCVMVLAEQAKRSVKEIEGE